MSSEWCNDNAPRIAARADRLDHFLLIHVDDRDVVGGAVGCKQELVVRREGKLPDALPHEQVLLDFQSLGIDDGDAVGWPERHEGRLIILGDAYADWLDRLSGDAGNLEVDLADDSCDRQD